MIQKDLPGDWISKPGGRGEWSVTITPSCLRLSGVGSNSEDGSPSQSSASQDLSVTSSTVLNR